MARPKGNMKRGPKPGKQAIRSRIVAKPHVGFTEEDERLFLEAFRTEGLNRASFIRSRIHAYAENQKQTDMASAIEQAVKRALQDQPKNPFDKIDAKSRGTEILPVDIDHWMSVAAKMEEIFTVLGVSPKIEFYGEAKLAFEHNFQGDWLRVKNRIAYLYPRWNLKLILAHIHFLDAQTKADHSALAILSIAPAWVLRSLILAEIFKNTPIPARPPMRLTMEIALRALLRPFKQ